VSLQNKKGFESLRKQLTFVCCAWYTTHHSFPVEELIIAYWTEAVEGVIGVGLVVLELCEEAFYWGLYSGGTGHVY
jgi:hypothetical protein